MSGVLRQALFLILTKRSIKRKVIVIGNTYLLYEPRYPWWLKDCERHLTETDICSLLAKYVSIITDELITVDYQNPENGG